MQEKTFEAEEMYKMHEINGVKPIYRGVNTEGSGTVVVIHQRTPGVAMKVFEDNKGAISNRSPDRVSPNHDVQERLIPAPT